MREYSSRITLNKNGRGVWSIDPSIGCKSGMDNNERGCYGDCYAFNAANRYGYDFGKTVLRHFDSESHLSEIKAKIKTIKMPFIRMGTMGDPSEDWCHTLDICESLQYSDQWELIPTQPKEIVIITKHWSNLTLQQKVRLKKLKVCINTSVSALDNSELLKNSLEQYEKLKGICRSVLRIVSCDFNTSNPEGYRYKVIQDEIFKTQPIIDTVFRPTKRNSLVVSGVINTRKKRFLKSKQLISKVNKQTYLGKCDNCKEMCGVNYG